MKYVKAAFNPQIVEEAMSALAVPKYIIGEIVQINSGREFNICVALRYSSEKPFGKWVERARTIRGYYNMEVIKEEEYVTLTQPQPQLQPQESGATEVLVAFEALVLIRSELCDVMKASEGLSKITGVKDITIHFGPFDISILVQAESANDFGDKFIHQIQAVEGVREATAYPVYKRIR